jgi:HlyD family secretion protein
MDRELADSVKQKRKRGVILKVSLGGVLFLSALIFLRHIIQPSISMDDFYTGTATIGNIEASVSASGTVLPEFEEIKNSPIQSTIIKIHHNTGDKVLPGDTILSLDTKTTLLTLEKMNDQLSLKKNSVDQLKLQLEKSLIDLRTQHQIKKLYVESMEAGLKEEKYLKSIGGGTLEMVKQAEMSLKIAKLELNQIQQTIENKEKSIRTDLKGLNFEINIQARNVRELSEQLNEATIKANKKGVITWINSQIGKTVGPGEELVKIANLQSYKVEGTISDMHISKLQHGGKVIVRINKDTELGGEVVSISPSIEHNIIQFVVKLEHKNHPLLRPNMKLDVFVQTDFKEQVVLVENGAFYRGSAHQLVYVFQGDKLIRKEVEFGKSNFDYVEIVRGLSAHDEVVISDMSDYEKYDEIKIEKK